ncbi:hypothetical protein AB4Z09_13610 [Rhodococcus sp. TAF43]|uniref:hypothetical protein n=1 Tax=Rhodococcus sp. TAF43 TaxID=3237483 RepID=UPI003F997188
MRWNGASDSRPSALLLAARLAKTDAEQEAVRDLAIRLVTTVAAGHRDLAQALILLDEHIVESLLGVLAAAEQKELRCAAAIMCSRTSDDAVAERLAVDKEPVVRKTLAREMRGREQNRAVLAVLRGDSRWSVRQLVQEVGT